MSNSQRRFQTPQRVPWSQPRGVEEVLAQWRSQPLWRNVVLGHRVPARAASHQPLPDDLNHGIAESLRRRGLEQLYTHQRSAYDAAMSGRDVVVATPTASGKSLCYNLPVLQTLAESPGSRALYMFPTKALSRDQEESIRRLMAEAGLSDGAITYDGDTPGDARRAARQRAGVLLTNPDMLHSGILPHHTGWARFFANLRYVVIDELHMYRGVFGSHLANVIRRLLRVARFHGAEPVFLMASATIGNPAEHAARILGRAVTPIIENGAGSGPREVVVYNPPVVNAELGVRESYLKTAVRLTAQLVDAGVPTLVFGQSRNGVEVMLKYLRDRLASSTVSAREIVAYRGGYLPDTRRRIEAGLRAGDIRCVVATNALELGIDIGALDAVVCAGYPGSMAGLWQRFGRAGRRGETSLAVMVASSLPLDQFFANAPDRLITAPVESARIDPDNVEILIQHLKCAVFELPFDGEEQLSGIPRDVLAGALDYLAHHRVVHAVAEEGRVVHHWASDAYPASHVSLRTIGWDNFVIIDLEGDRTIAEMDWRSTHTMLHEQAIYQHDGRQYQVERLDFDNRKAFVRHVKPDYYTTAELHTKVTVVDQDEGDALATGGTWSLESGLGEVSVVEQVVGFKKVKFHTHENVGYGEVHLPEMQKHTSAFWLVFPEAFVCAGPEPRSTVVDALRGISRAMHLAAASGLMVDMRDLGRTLGERSGPEGVLGTSVGGGFDPTIFLYDTVPGGIGLAERIFDERETMLRRVRALIESCPCKTGCPGCIGPAAGGDTPIPGRPMGRKEVALAVLDRLGVEVTH